MLLYFSAVLGLFENAVDAKAEWDVRPKQAMSGEAGVAGHSQ